MLVLVVVLVGVEVRRLGVRFDRAVFLRAAAEIHCGPTAQQDVLEMGYAAFAPGPDFKAVLVLPLPSGAGYRARTSPGLRQVGTVCPSVHGRGQDVSSPMLQTSAAGLATAGPGGEV